MTKYYAAYRVLEPDNDRIRLRSEFYDENPDFNTTGKHFMSFAAELDDLTDAQLEELKNRVGREIEIRMSEDWNADQKEHGIIFLIRASVYEYLGTQHHADAATKLDLKTMRQQYVDAKTHKQFDKTIIAPLTHCVICANHVRKSQSAPRKRGVKATTISQRLENLLYKRPELADSTADQLAAVLKCSSSAIKSTPTWREITRKREGARNAFRNRDITDADEYAD